MHILILFAVGIVVGVMNAIAGGGMLLGFPALLAAGLAPLAANVTGYLALLPGQLASAYGYRDCLRRLPRYYLILLVPCFVGAATGALILRHTSNEQFGRLVPVLILFAVVLFAIQPFLHFHLRRHISQKSRDLQTLLVIGVALLPIATYAGYFGAGFGFIMLAFLSFTNLRDTHQMNALKNLAGATIAATATVFLLSTHLINWPLGLSMAAGNAIGGYGGACFAQRFSVRGVRIFVILVGFSAAAYLALRNY